MTVWFVGAVTDLVGVTVTIAVFEAPGAMLSREADTPVLARFVVVPLIEKQPAVHAELSLFRTVSVKLACFGNSVLRLSGLRLTVGTLGWQVAAARVTVKVELA